MPPPDTPDLTLAHSRLLAGLPRSAIQQIEESCRWLVYAAEDVVLGSNDKLEGIYFIVSGIVSIRHPRGSADQEQTARFGAGEAFGELSAIDGGGRAATIVADAPAVVAVCPRDLFLNAVEQHPALAMRLIQKLAGIIRAADSRPGGRERSGGPQRVYAELLRLATPDPDRPTALEIRPVPPHREIARRAETTPDIVARALGSAMRANLLCRQGGRLVIEDPDRLERVAAGRET